MIKEYYKTGQRKELFEYMKQNCNEFVSAESIQKYLQQKGKKVGLTTIYRFLNSLEEQRKVRVELKEHTKYYQYILEECNNHFHLKCEKCGKLIHLHCNDIEKFKKHISKEHEFEIDYKTPILGVCKYCQKGK